MVTLHILIVLLCEKTTVYFIIKKISTKIIIVYLRFEVQL